ncbi:hypothetical protein BFP97_06855 [Roseivirga sp. 4D4]|uniref:hypothetical protein n=1 Tax=Roseivirga sp. 4D4 TaxID=1889784 RepID=UPI0008536D43|nr:hypothetical protein [Roseivirga sp. 4D4]OEK01246.1 hypothetical protein BFP97_06855 [Roseivirga sp. 4D4]
MLKIRPYFLLSILLCLFWACQKQEIEPITEDMNPVKIDESIPFRLLVKGKDKLDIRLNESDLQQTAKVYITSGQDTTELAVFTPESLNRSLLTINIEHAFPQNEIDLLLEVRREYNDTIYQIPVLNYTHRYVNDIQSERLIEFDDFLYEYDLSPDGSTFFYSIHPSDGISNARLYSYNLRTRENNLLEENFRASDIRAISNYEYYYVTKYDGDKFLTSDSALLVRKNLLTKEEKRITEVSYSYGRFSRVIDDRILVARPVQTEPASYHINTTNDELTEVSFDFFRMREPRIDHIWLGNSRVLPNSGLQEFDLAGEQDFNIIAYDNVKEQVQGTLYSFEDDDFFSFQKLVVYENGNIILEEPEKQRKSMSVVNGKNPAEKPIIIYQQFHDNSYGANDGFYWFSASNPSGQLLLSEPESKHNTFWIDDDHYINVTPNGLDLYTVPNDLDK